MRPSIALVFLSLLVGCTPVKKTAYVEYKKSIAQIPKGIEFSLDLKNHDKVLFNGQLISSGSDSTPGGMLYPAANGGMFLASIITHAITADAVNNSQKNSRIEESNKVLQPYLPTINTLSADLLLETGISRLNLDPKYTIYKGSSDLQNYSITENNKLQTRWSIYSQPVFFMSQDEKTIVLKNMIEVFQQDKPLQPIYKNISEISSSNNIESSSPLSYWTSDNPPELHKVSIDLFSKSVEVALTDMLSKLSGSKNKEQTFRFEQGGKTLYERGTLVAKNDQHTTIRTLRGWLKSIPNENIIK